MMFFHRRNWSPRAENFRSAEAFVVSVPKSGRTWLRVLFQAYLTDAPEGSFDVDSAAHDGPRIKFTHDRWSHRTMSSLRAKASGRYLIPPDVAQRPIILLVRNPIDVFVSLYYQLYARRRVYHGNIGEMLGHRLFGICSIIRTMNDWYDEWGGKPHCRIVHYEALRAAPAMNFTAVMQHLGFKLVDMKRLEAAIAFSEFDRMREREARGDSNLRYLEARDVDDPNTFKARRGRIEGYVDELSSDQVVFARRRRTHCTRSTATISGRATPRSILGCPESDARRE